MDPKARLQANLNVLKKHDASITEIIDSSSHVVVYDFKEHVKWTKSNIEGTLFLFKRSKSPENGFFIMNRLGVENLMCFLTENVELQITPEYIIYRADQAIQPDGNLVYGLWVFEPEDRDRVAKKLVNLKSISTQTPASAPTKNSLPATSSAGSTNKSSSNDQNIDVFGLLQKAFDAHGVKGAASSSSAQRNTDDNPSTRRKSPPPQQPPGSSLLKGVDLDGKFLLSLIQPEGKGETSSPPAPGSNVIQTRKKQEKSTQGTLSEEKIKASEASRVSNPRYSKKTPSSSSATTITNKSSQQPTSSSIPFSRPQTSSSSKTPSKQQQEQGRGRDPSLLQQETASDDPTLRPSHPPGLAQPMQHAIDEQQPPQSGGSGSQLPQQHLSQNSVQLPMQPHVVHPPSHPIFPMPFPPPPGTPLSPHMIPFPPGPFPMLPPGNLLYPPHAAVAAGTAFAARFYGNPGGGPISKDEFVGALFHLMKNDSLFMNFAYQTYLNSPKP